MEDPMMPDLSHLSAEEREIIEQVLRRQKEEEVKETQIAQKADVELDQIDKQINERKESARRLVGTQDDAICQICQKTKFADGIGHKCFYCQLRSCARCGGRAQSKNKAIWACSLCQQRQKILAKTGKWFQPDEPVKGGESGAESPPMDQSPMTSAAPTGIPQIIAPATTTTAKINGPQVSQSNHQQQPPPQQRQPPASTIQRQDNGQANGAIPRATPSRQEEVRRQNSVQRQSTVESRRPPNGTTQVAEVKTNRLAEPAKNRSQSTIERGTLREQTEEEKKLSMQPRGVKGSERSNPRPREGPSFSTQNNEQGNMVDQRVISSRKPETSRKNEHPRSGNESQSPTNHGPFDQRSHNTDIRNQQHNNFSSTATRTPEFRRTRSIREDDNRRGSIGVRLQTATPTEVLPVPAANPQPNQRSKKSRLHRQIRSMSSSDEELPSTSEGFGGEEARQRVPNECTSEKDLLRYIYGSEKAAKNGRKTGAVSGYSSENSPRLSGRGGPPAVLPGNMLAAKIRTYLSHPVTWQPSADQRRLIGHMVLHRTDSGPNGDLGLKVVGGRRSDTGRLGAFVTRVKAGSVADTVGRLRSGDEVLEWNGQQLQNATFDQVYEIISASKHESQVELIVSRSARVPGGDDFLNVQEQKQLPQHGPLRHLPNPDYVLSHDPDLYVSPSVSPHLPPNALSHSQSAMLPMQNQMSPRHRTTSTAYYSDGLPGLGMSDQQCYGRGQIFGRIELSLFFSHQDRQLTVTVERAFDLPPRPDGAPRNPYVKLFLLPDRSEKSRRQSSVLAETITPIWGESFFYQSLTEPLLMDRALEVTVWDYDKYDTNSFLGETLVDFSTIPLDGQPLLFTLVDMDDENPLRTRLRQRKLSQYTGYPPRPQSELGFGYNARPPPPPHMNDPYDSADYLPRGGPESYMRRSRTYDRPAGTHGRLTPVRTEEDWNINQSSGYLSDHGYSHQPTARYRQRRPRSATAMRQMTAAEMGASRMYSRHQPDQWEDAATPEQHRLPPHMRYPVGDPRSPNGRVMMEAMQEQQGYGSDGSETLSLHSANSMPVVRTINRRAPVPNGGDREQDVVQEASMEDYMTDDQIMTSAQKNSSQQNMKDRKKSIMNRFIPGRGAGGADAKRTGFARSEEVGIPGNLSTDRLQTAFTKQASKESTDSGDNWLPVLPDGPLGTFVDNLGPGQVVGRQVLASPVLGEIQIAIMAGRGGIEVEVIKANNLVVKPGTKISPAPYVKVYLMEGKQCIAKAKTNAVKRTTSPLIQQRLQFNENPRKKMLQITVLGDYGRMERKAFMGIAQIRLDDLQLGPQPVTGWYKLYHSSSLAGTGPVRKDSETSLLGGQS